MALVFNFVEWFAVKRSEVRSLPTELMMEILVRLPLKQLSRAQLVCKEWKGLIQDHYFIQRQAARTPVIYHWKNITSFHLRDRTVAPSVSFRFMHGYDGVVILYNYISEKYILWNPAIFRVLELPDPNPGIIELTLLYVPATRDYRIVSFYYKDNRKSVGCETLTLKGPSMSWKWKTLELPFPGHVQISSKKVFVIPTGREVHCVFVTMEDVRMIVTLDVEAESFAVNHAGDDVPTTALDWDGKLGFVNIVGNSLELIKLHDYKAHKWGAEKTIIPLPFKGSIHPLFTKGGDIWFWYRYEDITLYNFETGEIEHVAKARALYYKGGQVYPYKPSLLSFEGTQSDKENADLEGYRPQSLCSD